MIIAKYPFPEDTRLMQQAKAMDAAQIPTDIISLRQDRKTPFQIKWCNYVRVFRMLGNRQKKDSLIRYLAKTASFLVQTFLTLMVNSFRINYAVIVVHTLPEIMVFVTLFHRLSGSRIILDGRDLTCDLLQSRWPGKKMDMIIRIARWGERGSIKLCSHVITASFGFRQSLIDRGTDHNRITVIENTADEEIFRFDSERTFREISAKAKLIYHGTVSERFGLRVAVEAMGDICQKIPGSTFHVYGYYDMQYLDKLRKTAKDSTPENCVHFFPAKSLEEIYATIRQMDFGIVPYLSDAFMNKALSTKTFEYASAGIPVVASRLTSSLRIFSDDSIEYFEPNCPKDLARKVIALCMNPSIRQKKVMSANATFNKYSSQVIRQRFVQTVEMQLYGGSDATAI